MWPCSGSSWCLVGEGINTLDVYTLFSTIGRIICPEWRGCCILVSNVVSGICCNVAGMLGNCTKRALVPHFMEVSRFVLRRVIHSEITVCRLLLVTGVMRSVARSICWWYSSCLLIWNMTRVFCWRGSYNAWLMGLQLLTGVQQVWLVLWMMSRCELFRYHREKERNNINITALASNN